MDASPRAGTVMLRIERQGQRVLAWIMLCAMLALAVAEAPMFIWENLSEGSKHGRRNAVRL
jgi:hypothetical protein